jgi:UDP-N-acetylmuramate dehydrogenase
MSRADFVAQALGRLGPDRFRASVPLATLTTFRVGGPADWLAEVHSVDELRALVAAAAAERVPVSVLGGGSNVLIADTGVRGVVIRLHLTAITQPHIGVVRAEAGVSINGLVRWTVGRGLAGIEAWAGTPGTVGGAIYGNAHWGGQNIGDLVDRALLLTPGGELLEVPGAEMGFAYDTSRLQRTRETLVWAEFRVSQGQITRLRDRAKASLHYRKRTQPLAMPSAGCIFQNPAAGVDRVPDGIPPSAGALIDRAGLKGFRIGGAVISPVHANFIVNDGGATAKDIRALIEHARTSVARRFGVLLRDEIVYLGHD